MAGGYPLLTLAVNLLISAVQRLRVLVNGSNMEVQRTAHNPSCVKFGIMP